MLRKKLLLMLLWLFLSIFALIIEYYTGPILNFPILSAIPIGLAAWFNSRLYSILLGLLTIMIDVYYLFLWKIDIIPLNIFMFILLRLIILITFIILIDKIVRQKKEIKLLKGMLPICSFCKKIRDQNNNWIQFEKFILDNSEASFTHGICPDCLKKNYNEFYKKNY